MAINFKSIRKTLSLTLILRVFVTQKYSNLGQKNGFFSQFFPLKGKLSFGEVKI